MKHKQYNLPATLILKLATLIALTIAFLASGCETSKSFRSDINDTTAVKKSELVLDNINKGANLRTEDNQSHEENEWFRLTLKYLADKKEGDTTINNFITQPATIIYEKGNTVRDATTKKTDSNWYHDTRKMVAMAIDSMSQRIDNYEKNKHSETKGIGWMTIMLVGVGLIAFQRFLVPRNDK